MVDDFDEELDRVSSYASRATGFENLDEVQIFLPGLYVLGGSPRAGETNATVILLSALNREGNKGMSNALFSFKESGAIEYSADVTWHLGFPVESEEEQKILPRRVELKCMKNRNGATYKVEFEYYADSDYFCPCGVGFKQDGDFKGDTKKKKTNRH